MMNAEKVISDLEQCLDDSVAAVVPADTVRDAIVLLKAQEPHIISVNTVKALPNGAVVWQETNHPECERLEVGMVCKREGYAADIVFQTGEMFLDDLTETPEYFDGYKLRYWYGKPTEEQMEEMPWN